MATRTSHLEVFEKGVAQLFSTLTDDADDETAINAACFALQAAGEDEVKLQALVRIIYGLPSAHITCSAKLLLALFENATDNTTCRMGRMSGETCMSSKQLVRSLILGVGQEEFTTAIECADWPARSIDAMIELYQSSMSIVTVWYIRDMLQQMAESDHLFKPPNFHLFIRACIVCGPKLAEMGESDYVAGPLSQVAARASSESLTFRLAIVGLIQVRDSGWKIEMDVSPRARSEYE